MITDYQRKRRRDNCCARNREATENVETEPKPFDWPADCRSGGKRHRDTIHDDATTVPRPTITTTTDDHGHKKNLPLHPTLSTVMCCGSVSAVVIHDNIILSDRTSYKIIFNCKLLYLPT